MKIFKIQTIPVLLFTFLALLAPTIAKASSPTLKIDVCDVDSIYNTPSGYSYSIPKDLLVNFLHGKAFDNPDFYTADELVRLTTDINAIFQDIMSRNPVREKLAVITAGSPGSGKTVLVKQLLQRESNIGNNFAYICPDDVCLKQQLRTYIADVNAGGKSFEARKNAYNKWRPGSNAATHLILANLIKDRFAFYFGTTSSSPFTYKFYEFLKNQGYRIKVLHVSSPDSVRWESKKIRDNTFIQTTEKDVKEKESLVPQRISDTFLKYADEIEFYYRADACEDAVLAAKWTKQAVDKLEGVLKIIHLEAYKSIKTLHNTAFDALKKDDLKWESAVESISEVS